MRRAMKWATFTAGEARWAAAKIGACSAAILVFTACGRPQAVQVNDEPSPAAQARIQVGAERTNEYLPLLDGKRIAVVTNQTGLIGDRHLVDSLVSLRVNVVKVFAPEHGFRGEADAGEHVKDGKDARTGLPIVSLYGSNKKPKPEQLGDVDIVVFDIQDVGVRFYTYIGTLHYIMEAAMEQGKAVIVLDRPNPNASYVDGPVLDMAHSSFVGMHPVPLVHGMTVGEFARMINGQGWLKGGKPCELIVVPCLGYDHSMSYELPVRPSPNLPNAAAVSLYPSLGLFEGTIVSVGRGTDIPFQCIGYPGNPVGRFQFTPVAKAGAKDPPYKGRTCTGLDLQAFGAIQSKLEKGINLNWLIGLYAEAPDKAGFFTPFFDKLAGGPALREQVIAGMDEIAIRASWKEGLDRFATVRAKYLLYP
ncbi:MAG: exo-beta-N-acetylmuramidase NamZ family protein [Flavobacteriales bacterium]